jgi:hypothetical protein
MRLEQELQQDCDLKQHVRELANIVVIFSAQIERESKRE